MRSTRGPHEMSDDNLTKAIPRKWGKLMTSRKDIQAEFNRRLDEAREEVFTTSNDKSGESSMGEFEFDVDAEEIRSRLQKIQDRHPEFMSDLAFLVEPLVQSDKPQRDKSHSQREKPYQDRTELGQVLEKKKKTSKARPLAHMDREQIQKTCRRYGLGRTWNDLLVMLNQVNSASSGKLFDKTNA